jgi:thiamine biosynthesis lipoprotein ApbE
LSSVLASTAVWAEVFATATLVAGASTAGLMLEARGLAGRFERVNGEPIHTRAFERFER